MRHHTRSLSLIAARTVFLGAVTFSSAGYAAAGDADNDGVADAADVFPCNTDLSSVQFFPAENSYNTLYVEDQWPSDGDYDFNDLVLDQNFEVYKNAAGQVKQLRITYHPRAYGALFDNGLALQLPISSSALAGIQITRKVGNGTATSIAARTGETRLVIDAAQNIRAELFGGATGQINTIDGNSVVAGSTVEINVTFATPIALTVTANTFDTFIFRSNDRSHEIHKPQFLGTSTARMDLFGTLNDGSNAGPDLVLASPDFQAGEMLCVSNSPDPGRCYVNQRGVPFVLEVPTSSKFPKEDTRIDALFPDIVSFGASGGVSNQNFFATNVNNARASALSLGAAPNIAVLSSLRSGTCLNFSSCKAIRDAGAGSTSGQYTIDPDGTGSGAPFNVYCDMTTDGGGWTLVARFSNADVNNWMEDTGAFWYDRTVVFGNPVSRSENADAFSPAFHAVAANELKITRTDNLTDDALLRTTSNCLAGNTFRNTMTSLGIFRNTTPWGADSVKKTCAATLGNNFAGTSGFSQAQCSADIAPANTISFFSDFSSGDGAVLMIGGGGSACARADHGIGITEANAAAFQTSTSENDFGDNATGSPVATYGLNLFVR